MTIRIRSLFSQAFAPDSILVLLLFLSASLLTGRVDRPAFDDEVFVFNLLQRHSSLWEVFLFHLHGNDVHPPGSSMVFAVARDWGMNDTGMRLISLGMTAVALLLLHRLALRLMMTATGEPPPPLSRLISVLVFGLCPLAVSQGDAVRWYPLFAMLTALFVTMYLNHHSPQSEFFSSIPLGLAISTNFLGFFLLPALAIYRYGLQRRFRWRFDLPYAGLTGVCALPGMITLAALSMHPDSHRVTGQTGGGMINAGLIDLLGYFGGVAIAPTRAWLLLPAVLLTGLALYGAIDRRRRDHPAHLILLIILVIPVLVALQFSKPRSLLYLAPLTASLTCLWCDRLIRQASPNLLLGALAGVLSGVIVPLPAIQQTDHPFKRNAAVPIEPLLDFIDSNRQGETLVITSEANIEWELQRHAETALLCVPGHLRGWGCLAEGHQYQTVIFVERDLTAASEIRARQFFANLREHWTDGRTKIATVHVGFDQDAGIKSRLSGRSLDEHILTVDLYR